MALSSPPSSVSGLGDMPVEVLTNIANHLDYTLYDFVLVSRKLHDAGQWVLRAWRGESEHKTMPFATGQRDMHLWIRELMYHPELARSVKRLTILDHEMWYEDHHNPREGHYDKSIYHSRDPRLIRDHINTVFGQQSNDGLLDEFILGLDDAVVAVTLSLLWNLEELEFVTWSGDRSVTRDYRVRAANRQHGRENTMPMSFALPRLSKVTLKFSYDDPNGGADEYSILQNWGMLRSVRVIHAENMGRECECPIAEEEDYYEPYGDYGSSSVTKLVLTRAGISPWELAHELGAHPNLKHFKYENDWPDLGLDHDISHIQTCFAPSKFGRALSKVKDSLETLCVRYIDGHKSAEMEEHFDFPVGSFKDFPRLRTIRARAELFTGDFDPTNHLDDLHLETYPSFVPLIDALPPNIELLELWDCDQRIVLHLIELATRFYEVPRLKKIVLGKAMDGEVFTGEEMECFAEMAREAGVEVEML